MRPGCCACMRASSCHGESTRPALEARPSELSRLLTLAKIKQREEGTFSPENTDRPRTHARTHTHAHTYTRRHARTHAPGPTLARSASATLIQRQRNDPALPSQRLEQRSAPRGSRRSFAPPTPIPRTFPVKRHPHKRPSHA